MKRYSPIFLLAFLFYSCNYESDSITEATDFTLSRIDASADFEINNLLSNTLSEQTAGGRTIPTYLGEVDLNDALKVEDLRNGVMRYTFKFQEPELAFKNLIIKVKPNGESVGYFMNYYPSQIWVSENIGYPNYLTYTGDITITTLKGYDRYRLTFENGSGIIYEVVDNTSGNGRVECDGGDSGNGSGSGSSGDGSESDDIGGGAQSGSVEFYWYSGGGGDNPDPDPDPDEEDPIEEDKTEDDIDEPPGGLVVTIAFSGDELNNITSGGRVACDTEPNPEGDCVDDGCPEGEPVGSLPPNLNLCENHPCLNSSCPDYDQIWCKQPCEGDPLLTMEISDYNLSRNSNRYGCVRTGATCEGTSGRRKHHGIDLKANEGTPIHSLTSGTVYYAQNNHSTLGNWIIIQSGDYYYSYSHMMQAPSLEAGDNVNINTILGYIGDTGNPGPGEFHLHLEIRNISSLNQSYNDATSIDPEGFLGTIFDSNGNVLTNNC